MSLKFFFVFVLCIVSAYSHAIHHKVEMIGDHTDHTVKETGNGVEVSGWGFFLSRRAN